MTEDKKPLIVELEDAKNEFVQFIKKLQNHGLSCYLIEAALSSAWTQLRDGAKIELEMAKKSMATESGEK
jgi:hypothetical protein